MRRGLIAAVALVAAIAGAVAYLAVDHSGGPAGNQGPLAGSSQQPAIPSSGAYLGAWVNPAHLQAQPGQAELQQLSGVQQSIGRHFSILHIYSSWTNPVPTPQLQAIYRNGSVPLLDWGEGPLNDITSGKDDQAITAYATTLRGLQQPIFLRWAWEMNLPMNPAHAAPASYISAWQHIWNIFHQLGVKNVAFVWCPSVGRNTPSFYPGDSYVDWIAADGYDDHHSGGSAFSHVFAKFYATWVGHNKPIMVAETGAMVVDQAQYLDGVRQLLPKQFPNIKALVYFDAVGPRATWNLAGSGLSSFKALAGTPYFGFQDASVASAPNPGT